MPGGYVSNTDLSQAECAGPVTRAPARMRTYVQMAHDAAAARRALADAARARRAAEAEEPIDPAYVALEALLAANDDGPVSAPIPVRRLVTKAPGRQHRKSGVRQSADASKMRAHTKAEKAEAVKEHTPSITPTSSSTTKSTSTTKPTHRPRDLAPWKEAGELPRLIACNRALAEMGQPFAFSVNFDPRLIRAANENARGFLDFVRRRVTLALKRGLGRTVATWFALETDDDGRPHIHGGLALNDNEDPALVEEALAKAGGNWTRMGSRCADVRRQWEPDGWAVYPLKRIARTRRHLREAACLAPKARVAVYSVTAELRAAGERLHGEVRRALQAPRHIPAIPEATPTAPESVSASTAILGDALGLPATGLISARLRSTDRADFRLDMPFRKAQTNAAQESAIQNSWKLKPA